MEPVGVWFLAEKGGVAGDSRPSEGVEKVQEGDVKGAGSEKRGSERD